MPAIRRAVESCSSSSSGGGSTLTASTQRRLDPLKTQLVKLAREELRDAIDEPGTDIFNTALQAGVNVSSSWFPNLLDKAGLGGSDCTFTLDESEIFSLDDTGKVEKYLLPTASRFKVQFDVTCNISATTLGDDSTPPEETRPCRITFQIRKIEPKGRPSSWNLTSSIVQPPVVWCEKDEPGSRDSNAIVIE